jgi:uncharacterized membrane protein
MQLDRNRVFGKVSQVGRLWRKVWVRVPEDSRLVVIVLVTGTFIMILCIDDRFIAKELSKSELDAMTNFAPAYFHYMSNAILSNVRFQLLSSL